MWEALDYKAGRFSSTVAISGCHTSHITNSRCALFLAQSGFFLLACANLWIGVEKSYKFIVLQMVLQIVFFFLGVAILLGKTTINSTTVCFAPDFFLAFPHAAPDTCFVYFFDFFVHQIVLFFAFLRAP